MIAALTLILAVGANAGVVRAPIVLGVPATLGAPPVSLTGSGPVLPAYLSVANPADALKLSAVLQAAQASPTAMKVLAKVEAFAAERGRPIVIEVQKMKGGGAYSLDSGVLSLRRRDIDKDTPRANVSLIIHELQHVLQTARELPSDLLETEVESYMVDFRIQRELGDTPRPNSTDAKLQAKFKQGFEPFIEYLAKKYPEDSPFYKTKSRDYRERLEKGLEKSKKELAGLQAERAERLRVLKQLKTLDHPKREILAYRQDEIAPLDAKIAEAKRAVDWAIQDIALMLNPEKLAQARAYARSVIRRMKAYQPVFAGN
jgi:hypothetical protein